LGGKKREVSPESVRGGGEKKEEGDKVDLHATGRGRKKEKKKLAREKKKKETGNEP